MARADAGAGSPLRRALTLLVVLVALGLIATGGTLLHAQQAAVRTVPGTSATAGRSVSVCATGTVPAGSATPEPQPSNPASPGATPTPGATVPVTPSPAPSATPSATPSPSVGGSAAAGDVAVVASGPVSTSTPAPEGRLTLSRLGAAAKADLTVDEQGHGAALARAGAPVVLLAEGSIATTASGAVLSDNADGPESGLEAAPCLPPTTAAWFPGVASGANDRTELVLSNPDDAQAELDLKFYGRRGRVVVPGSPGVVVAARSSRSVSLTGLVNAEGPLGVSVQATVGRVSAVARRIRTVEDKPAGADWVVPAATPALTSVIPAVPGELGTRQLVVTNPSTVRATVSVQVLGLQGPYAPVGAESLTLPPESSGAVELSAGLAGGAGGIKVTADQPVTAAVTATSARTGATPDIAVQSASPALVRTGVAAVATTNDADAELVVSNGADADVQVHFDVLSYAGVLLRTDAVLIAANGTATRRLNSPAPSYVVLRVPDGSAVVGGVVLSRPTGAVAGLSTLPLTSPDVAARVPSVQFDPSAGR